MTIAFCLDRFSEATSQYVQGTFYYIGYFLMRFYDHFKQNADVATAVEKSTIDIFSMLCVAGILKFAEEIIKRMTSPSVLRSGSLFFCHTVLPMAYSAYQQGVVEIEDAKTFMADTATFVLVSPRRLHNASPSVSFL